jgi:hypothetical protein
VITASHRRPSLLAYARGYTTAHARNAGCRAPLTWLERVERFPYVANRNFRKPKHLYSWKTLVRCEKNWPTVKQALRANVDIALTLFRHGSWAAA